MEDCVLVRIRWLFKNNSSLAGFAGARCAFHNVPIMQTSSVARADTMTFLSCPILAWLPATSLPTQYNFRCAFHVYLPPPHRPQGTPLLFVSRQTKVTGIFLSPTTCACSTGALKKETCFPPPRFLVSPPSLPTLLQAPHPVLPASTQPGRSGPTFQVT